MDKRNSIIGDEIPLGFGMALAQNGKAMKYFADLNEWEKQNIISRTHQIKAKEEMQKFVENLV